MRAFVFGLALLVVASPAFAAPSAKQVMAAWDDNGDGVLTKAEWLAAGHSAKSFAYADTNHDGKVTMAELKVALAKARKAGLLGD